MLPIPLLDICGSKCFFSPCQHLKFSLLGGVKVFLESLPALEVLLVQLLTRLLAPLRHSQAQGTLKHEGLQSQIGIEIKLSHLCHGRDVVKPGRERKPANACLILCVLTYRSFDHLLDLFV